MSPNDYGTEVPPQNTSIIQLVNKFLKYFAPLERAFGGTTGTYGKSFPMFVSCAVIIVKYHDFKSSTIFFVFFIFSVHIICCHQQAQSASTHLWCVW
jgi:hypothetical protein